MQHDTPKTVLQEAEAVVEDRRASYGDPAENHARTAAMWTEYLGRRLQFPATITAHDVCMLNALQKISREANAPKRDNLVDIAGFCRNAELVQAKTEPSPSLLYPTLSGRTKARVTDTGKCE
jgi:hypothetical protein